MTLLCNICSEESFNRREISSCVAFYTYFGPQLLSRLVQIFPVHFVRQVAANADILCFMMALPTTSLSQFFPFEHSLMLLSLTWAIRLWPNQKHLALLDVIWKCACASSALTFTSEENKLKCVQPYNCSQASMVSFYDWSTEQNGFGLVCCSMKC